MVADTSSLTSMAEWLLISGGDLPNDSPPELALVQNGDFKELLESKFARDISGASLSGLDDPEIKSLRDALDYAAFLEGRIIAQHSVVPSVNSTQWLLQLLSIGVGALRAFLQASVTGPPLSFSSEKALLPEALGNDAEFVRELSKNSISSLSVDGESAYHLMPNPLLLILAKTVLNSTFLAATDALQTVRWWRLRINFLHQRVLSEKTGTLHKIIATDVDSVAESVLMKDKVTKAMFLVEKAMVDTCFGNERKALRGLEEAAELTGLKYALTGIMGKRTKFQQKDTSQLVVLAKSADLPNSRDGTKPQTVDLNDDTLLESISFTRSEATTIKEDNNLPPELVGLDPGEQPPLHPLDSTILLLMTETIKNNNPDDGITREQMQPYTERALSHSSNWGVYTLGLLVRSRLEGSRSRTVERGLLQLQAVVDQVIANTTGYSNGSNGTTSFLPKAANGESAPVRERLLYIHQLPTPTRWELEAELASLWTHFGGLKTALEIYERLEMWPEVALCWAATEREDKAREIIRIQLFDSATGDEIVPPPPQTPRLWCILGDIEDEPAHYERSWAVSSERYPRAQRSLGRRYMSAGDHEQASNAYQKALRIFPLHEQSWFALGCCYLELERWEEAARAFTRTVGLNDTDAEAWSNLATAFLRREPSPEHRADRVRLVDEEGDEGFESAIADPQRSKKDALKALKNACRLKRDSWRIWDNYLTVAASLDPPSYVDVIAATKQLISLRKDSKGELSVDNDILEALVRHIIMTEEYVPSSRDIQKQVIELVERDVVPIITTDPRLWRIVARLELWRKRPKSALDAHEKAWRAVNSRPGISDATEKEWNELVDATVDLVDAYESLGQMERTEGLAVGEPVAKDWRFKARSAVRSVLGRGMQNWEGTAGWDRLKDSLEGLKV